LGLLGDLFPTGIEKVRVAGGGAARWQTGSEGMKLKGRRMKKEGAVEVEAGQRGEGIKKEFGGGGADEEERHQGR
jgi:hypothetical protein